MNKVIAIIPARGGSKRIPGKNIKPFFGKPVIEYSIEAAMRANIFDEIMVSTDDVKIAEVSNSSGASVPFMRSPQNSDDHATIASVLDEVIQKYMELGKEFEYFCCIYPVAPLVDYKVLQKSYEIIQKNLADTVLPVIAYSHPIQRAFQVTSAGKLEMINPEYMTTRTQDLLKTYHDSGQFFFMNTKSFLQKGMVFTDNMEAIEIPEINAQDIDTEEDWRLAELKYRLMYDIK